MQIESVIQIPRHTEALCLSFNWRPEKFLTSKDGIVALTRTAWATIATSARRFSQDLQLGRSVSSPRFVKLNIINIMDCNHCNKNIPDDSKFCPFCGGENSMPNSNKKIPHIPKNLSLKSILLAIAIGVWILVLQNLGIIPVSQSVNVINEVDVAGSVRVDNTVDVSVVDY